MSESLTVMAEILSGLKLRIIFQDLKKKNPHACHTFDSVAKVENKCIYSKMMIIFLQSGNLGKKRKYVQDTSSVTSGDRQVSWLLFQFLL